jgi:hypothetical protein
MKTVKNFTGWDLRRECAFNVGKIVNFEVRVIVDKYTKPPRRSDVIVHYIHGNQRRFM